MVREQKNNYVALSGEVIQEPTYSHSAGGEDYFTFPLRCLRLSGAEDLLNIILPRSRLEQLDAQPGDRVGLVGQVRSYNNHSGQGSKLVITVRVQELFPAPAQEDSNRVLLVGNLCRKPVYRRTPLGREIADLLLAVNRGSGKADYLPCIAWGRSGPPGGLVERGRSRVRPWEIAKPALSEDGRLGRGGKSGLRGVRDPSGTGGFGKIFEKRIG